jgi:hypothetical protein
MWFNIPTPKINVHYPRLTRLICHLPDSAAPSVSRNYILSHIPRTNTKPFNTDDYNSVDDYYNKNDEKNVVNCKWPLIFLILNSSRPNPMAAVMLVIMFVLPVHFEYKVHISSVNMAENATVFCVCNLKTCNRKAKSSMLHCEQNNTKCGLYWNSNHTDCICI